MVGLFQCSTLYYMLSLNKAVKKDAYLSIGLIFFELIEWMAANVQQKTQSENENTKFIDDRVLQNIFQINYPT
jgi:hypothetical protein